MYRIIGANQVEYGPITADQLRQWIAEGRADANTRTKVEGTEDWQPLSSFPEFASLFAQTPPPPTMAYPPGSNAYALAPNALPPVSNYLVQAILCTLCCCVPGGIVAIVYAAQVNGKLQAGDYQGALKASKTARLWCWVSFGIGLALGIIWFLLAAVSSVQS
ncbi:MAG: hypothetical protein JWQ71_1587 [Pedosphaera sp.]|nr:hypothetical protein [Pedosphaera sp.]